MIIPIFHNNEPMSFKFSTNFLLPFVRKPAKYGGRGSIGLDGTPTVLIHICHPVELWKLNFWLENKISKPFMCIVKTLEERAPFKSINCLIWTHLLVYTTFIKLRVKPVNKAQTLNNYSGPVSDQPLSSKVIYFSLELIQKWYSKD